MNIIVKLTPSELRELVRKSLGIQSTVELVVVTEEHPLSKILRQVAREFPDHIRSEKIAAIRRLRELGPQEFNKAVGGIRSTIGLGEAKWAIENLEAAIDNLEKFGKIQTP